MNTIVIILHRSLVVSSAFLEICFFVPMSRVLGLSACVSINLDRCSQSQQSCISAKSVKTGSESGSESQSCVT